jgi:hypothetical protein
VSCGTSSTAKPASTKTPPAKLTATVRAANEVTLTDANGQAVSRLPSGWYTITVSVNASNADFHLTGPSVQRTASAFGSVSIWGVHFVKGTYRYMNDRNGGARSTHVISVY